MLRAQPVVDDKLDGHAYSVSIFAQAGVCPSESAQ